MKNKDNILNMFEDKDSKFDASKVLDAYMLSSKIGTQVVTDFVTPIFLSKVLSAFESEFKDYSITSFGGYDDAERRCIVFNESEYNYYDIDVIKITNNTKFNKRLEHREVLGSILGLGITRNKVGDIIFENDDCYVFVKNEISDYIIYNLEQIGRSKVKVELSSYESKGSTNSENIKTTTVSSLRVDTIISNITNYSRSDVKKLFDKELIFINWKVCVNASTIVKEGDIITVRKFGRIKLNTVKGISKKGKYIIDYSDSNSNSNSKS